jgi:hypothetical protein
MIEKGKKKKGHERASVADPELFISYPDPTWDKFKVPDTDHI